MSELVQLVTIFIEHYYIRVVIAAQDDGESAAIG